MKELDRRLAALGRAEIDHDLSGLEAAVWSKVDAGARSSLRPMPNRLAAAVCVSVAMLVSGAGAATAAASAASAHEATAFALDAPLAPSTVLGDR